MIKEVIIDWEGPLSQFAVTRENGGGVYQFYGSHAAYRKGKDPVLLYIGQATLFKDRLTERHCFLNPARVPAFFLPKEIVIYLGRVVSNEKGVSLDTIEGMLITAHPPAWNSDKVRIITIDDGADVIIHNTGDREDLLEKFVIKSSGEIKDLSE